jgi:hypothetical protein
VEESELFPYEIKPSSFFPAESRLKRLLSGFHSEKQVLISRLKAERWGKKVIYREGDFIPKIKIRYYISEKKVL